MKYRFRIPTWYKFTILIIYTLAGTILLDEALYSLHPFTLSVVLGLFIVIGVWIIIMWRKTIAVDIENSTIEISGNVVRFDDIVEYKIKPMGITLKTKEGRVVKFPYPIEDPDVLGRLLRGDMNEPF